MRPEAKGRFAAQMFTIVAVTLALAYYVPLYRTHEKLLADYASLAERASTSAEAAASARVALVAATAKNDAVVAAHEDREAVTARRDALVAKAEATCRDKLATEAGVSVARHGKRAVITLSAAVLRPSRDHLDVVPLTSLCGALSAIAAPLRMTVVAGLGSAKGKQNPWQSAADRAASVAHLVEQKCDVPPARLSAEARTANDDGSISIEIE